MNFQNPLSLFPLRMVLFPGGLLHLKVFEARYLDMVGQCLRKQQPFGVVCLKQGAEAGAGRRVANRRLGAPALTPRRRRAARRGATAAARTALVRLR